MTGRPAATLLGVASAVALTVTAGGRAAPREEPVPIVVAQVPAGAMGTDALAGHTLRAPIGEGGRLILVEPDGQARPLTADFDSAADPEVSFDGRALLFAGRKTTQDPWCAWEMEIETGATRRITCGASGVRQPIYQPTIYTITPTGVEAWIQIAFVGENPGERNEAGVAPNTSLWSCKTDGTALRRLTYNLSNDMDPVVLPDGRLVYAAWLRTSNSSAAESRIGLLGINGDGTDYQAYAGRQGRRVQQMPAPTADGRVVFVEADRIAGDGSGRLATVGQARPLHTYQSLTAEDDGFFRAPTALPDGRLLVAWRRAAPDLFGIHRLDPVTGVREKVYNEPGWHSVEARPVIPSEPPDARSSVVRDDDPEGKLYSVDVGIHDLGAQLPRGDMETLRVVEGVPASDDRPASRRILGEVPIADDGSYQVQVPANTPVQLQVLDEDGLAVRSSAWLWVRNHAAQGCVGCHEDPERTPPNRLMQALAEPAPVLNPPADRRRTVTSDDVAPIVASRCLACHGAGGRRPRLDGGVGALAPFVVPGEARRSPLTWHLLGRATVRPWDPGAGAAAPITMPPGAIPPTPAEIRTILEWIDLGGRP